MAEKDAELGCGLREAVATLRFMPCMALYGLAHPDNVTPTIGTAVLPEPCFYFHAASVASGHSFSGYVTRSDFDELATRLGLPRLDEVLRHLGPDAQS